MAKIQDYKCKQCRREGKKLFLKADRCYSPKCPIEKKGAIPPGVHGQKRKRKLSEYGIQLREKQKMKRTYGLSERQITKYYTLVKKSIAKKSVNRKKETKVGAGELLLRMMETRLDNVIFRAGLVPSRSIARQIVSHGHVQVNNHTVSIPSYQVKPDEVVNLKSIALGIPTIKVNLEKKVVAAQWLTKKAAVVKMLRPPERKEIEADIDEQLIIEFYSR